MKIENKIKKEIKEKWNNAFPNLVPFAQDKLYKILGPLVGGIEIFNLPRSEEYRPYIVWYPLWKSSLIECFKEPLTLQEMRNKKGLQYDIPYLKNDIFFDVISSTKNELIFPFSRNITLSELFVLIDSQFSKTLIKSSPVGQANLYEGKLLSALYLNDLKETNRIFNVLSQVCLEWQKDQFEWKYGKIEEWLQKLKNTINNRQDFLLQIESNKQDKKMSKLAYSELIL